MDAANSPKEMTMNAKPRPAPAGAFVADEQTWDSMPAAKKPPRCMVCLRPTATATGKPTRRRDRCRCREVFAVADRVLSKAPPHSADAAAAAASLTSAAL